LKDFTVEHLVFDLLGCSVGAQPRQMPALAGDRVQKWLDDHGFGDLEDVEVLRQLWWDAAGPDQVLGRSEVVSVRAAIEHKVALIENPPTEMGQGPTSDADRLRAAAQRLAAEDQVEPEPEPKPQVPVRRAARVSRTTKTTTR
jgi:hypothetical protein